MKTDSDTGNLATKCALCVHVPSGDGELHSAIEQGRCPLASFATTRRNALIKNDLIRDQSAANLLGRYSFVVLRPQRNPLKLWQSYHSPSAGHRAGVSIFAR